MHTDKYVLGVLILLTIFANPLPTANAANSIKVGILEYTGTMGVADNNNTNAILMGIEEINETGGLLGKKIETMLSPIANSWPVEAERFRELLEKDRVDVVFGCWHSSCRTAVASALETADKLLFTAMQDEGEQRGNNIFYTGATPNQYAYPAAQYLLSKDGGAAKRFVLIGTDYVFSRRTNSRLRDYLISNGIANKDIAEFYAPFGESDFSTIVKAIKSFASSDAKTSVIATLAGESNVFFFRQMKENGVGPKQHPIVSLTVEEDEIQGIDGSAFDGILLWSDYFANLHNSENSAFREKWKSYATRHGLSTTVATRSMMNAYLGVIMWGQAVRQAQSTSTGMVKFAMSGLSIKSPSGFIATMAPVSQHLDKVVYLAEIRSASDLAIVWHSGSPIKAQPWSPFIPGNRDLLLALNNGHDLAKEEQSKRLVTTFFGTNRTIASPAGAPEDRFSSDSGKLLYGTAVVSIPPGHIMGEVEHSSLAWLTTVFQSPDEHFVLKSATVITDVKQYFAQLRATQINTKKRRAVVYIHGIDTTFEDAAFRTAQLAVDLDIDAVPMFYSWPSQGHMAKAALKGEAQALTEYLIDKKSAEIAISNVATYLESIVDGGEMDEVYVIAHSMGGWLTTSALAQILQKREDLRSHFAELILAAPDIDTTVFKNDILPAFVDLKTSLTLYVSSNDLALKQSEKYQKSHRAGMGGPDMIISKGVETVDASKIDTEFLGHSYAFDASPLLTDIRLLINNRMRASERPRLTSHKSGDITYWEFRQSAR